jgi:MFS family permease
MFYHGWLITGLAILAIVYSSPGESFGLIVFTKYFKSGLGIDQNQIDRVYLISTLVAGFLSLPLGYVIDKYGIRVIISAFLAEVGLATIFLGYSTNSKMLTTGVVAVRLAGQSVLYVGAINLVSHWWVRKRGRALGITGLLHQILCVDGFPVVSRALIAAYGWRSTYRIIGASAIAVAMPLFALLVRDRPEQCGLHADGIAAPEGAEDLTQPSISKVDAAKAALVAEQALSVPPRAVFTSSVYWLYVFAQATALFNLAGTQFHLRSIWSERLLPEKMDQIVWIALGISAGVSQLVGGLLADRIAPCWPVAVGVMLLIPSLLALRYADNLGGASMVGLLMGASQGLVSIGTNTAFPNHFGVGFLGVLQGVSNMTAVISTSVGPIVVGAMSSALNGHSMVLYLLMLAPATMAVAAAVVAAVAHFRSGVVQRSLLYDHTNNIPDIDLESKR